MRREGGYEAGLLVPNKANIPSSSATTVQLVVSRLIAAMLLVGTPASATAALTAAPRAAHQSAGFCSAQPGWGKFVG